MQKIFTGLKSDKKTKSHQLYGLNPIFKFKVKAPGPVGTNQAHSTVQYSIITDAGGALELRVNGLSN